MNYMPTLTEPGISRGDIYKGIVSAYVIARKVAWQAFSDQEDNTSCLRVVRYLGDCMQDHRAQGTAFERKQ